MNERRKSQPPIDTEGYLRQLPAIALLDRLPQAIMGLGPLGDVTYANPACAEMFGYLEARAVTRRPLSRLLHGHETRLPTDSLDILRTTTSVVNWNHDAGYVIRTLLSRPLLLRATDTLLLIGITDITAWLWETDVG